jgi:hypothetical protein
MLYISSFYYSTRILKTKSKVRGGNVKGIGILHSFWGLQGIMDRNRPLDNWGFEF